MIPKSYSILYFLVVIATFQSLFSYSLEIRELNKLNKRILIASFRSIVPFLVATSVSTSSFASIDCNSDCYQNCVRVAPGSGEYCKISCKDYCQQDDRHDGLSGSVDAANGETGIFGGSIDGTVTRGQDRPPRGINIIPKEMLDMKSLMMNNGVKSP
jgi:hypothetical protein